MTIESGNNAIDSLLGGSWNGRPHTGVSLTYSFLDHSPSWASADDAYGFRPMTTAQMQAASAALALWTDVANISVTEAPAGQLGNIEFGTNDQSNGNSAGYAYVPGTTGGNWVALYLNNRMTSNDQEYPGSYGFQTMIHEIGHTLGLKHPGNYNSTGGVTQGPFLPAATDNNDYSIMSYNPSNAYEEIGAYSATPMLYDIQAVQYLYGANMSYHSGDDVYHFDLEAAPQCIWDAGGVNTFDFSGCGEGTVINLNAGSFSSTYSDLGNVSIAYGVTIQDAIGGAGNDRITCNAAGDTISAGAGDDQIVLGAGSDSVDGGSGTDTVIFAAPLAAHLLFNSGGIVTVTGEGTDTLSGVETLQFSDRSIAVSALASVAHAAPDQNLTAGTAFAWTLAADTFTPGSDGAVHLNATLAGGAALPSWLSFDPGTGRFSANPGAGDAGTLEVRIVATDGSQLSIADDFQLKVSPSDGIVHGTAANDILTVGSGEQTVDGGAGIDTLVVSGARAGYTLTAAGSGYTLTAQTGGGIDHLSNIERLQFADASIALDIGGDGGQVYRLYQAAFDRVPDAAGLGFWIAQRDAGQSLNALAQSFVGSAEFLHTYGELDDAHFVAQLYENVLHRAPDAGGTDFFIGNLASHAASRADVLAAFSESAENQAGVIGVIGNGFAYTPYGG